jgi:hypothetical protein
MIDSAEDDCLIAICTKKVPFGSVLSLFFHQLIEQIFILILI